MAWIDGIQSKRIEPDHVGSNGSDGPNGSNGSNRIYRINPSSQPAARPSIDPYTHPPRSLFWVGLVR
eukprot:2835073-Lingulodinium_polyedra.AAC.1